MELQKCGKKQEFTVPVELQELFINNLEKQKRLSKEIKNLVYKIKKSNYKNKNMLIKFYFKKIELVNVRDEISLMLDIFFQKDFEKYLLRDIKNNNLLDLI